METTKPQPFERIGKCSWDARNLGKCLWNDQQGDELPCILHDENPDKDQEKFKQAVYKLQRNTDQSNPVFLDGVIFPPNWSMYYWVENHMIALNRSISCRGATFQGKVEFQLMWFEGTTFFDNACFQDEVGFGIDGCRIEGEIYFRHATFQKSLIFYDVGFSKEIRFDSAIFKDKVSFGDHDLPISFSEDVSFDKAEFQKDTSFTCVNFEKGVSFNGAHFQGHTFFSPKLTFRRNQRKDSNKEIQTEPGDVSFQTALFNKDVSFDHIKFQGEVSFRKANFIKGCSFNHTEFQKKVDFDGASFEAEVFFKETSFKRDVLLGADFKSQVSFFGTKENLLFNDGERAIYASFEGARFIQPHFVQFLDVDFSQCILVGTDVRGIDFHGVRKWPQTIWLKIWKRKCVYEENKEPEILENAYRQVRQSFEDRRNYPEAGDFYYGEMDKKRKRYWWRRVLPSLTWLYWVSSGYGQRPSQAGIFLGLLLFLFTGLFIEAGMFVEENAPVERVGFWVVLWAYTLKVVTFGSPLYFTPISIWGDIWTISARILVPVQAALFVLAVNRAFKR